MTGDKFLLCSDGLSKTLSDADIVALLTGDGEPTALLIDAALDRRVSDNVTAVVVEIV